MTGVDSSELILLLIIGLIVLGPKRLPEIANRVGRWVGQARRMTRAMKRQLEEELNFDEDNSIGQPKPPPPSMLSSAATDPDDPANPEYDVDEPPAYIPQDDDTYSPIHDEEVNDAAADDAVVEEKRA